MKKYRFLTLILCVGIISGLLASCGASPNITRPGGTPATFTPMGEEVPRVSVSQTTYDDIYAAVKTVQSARYETKLTMGRGGVAVDAAMPEGEAAPAAAPPSSAPMEDGNSSPASGADYSETNTQVAGIDEGDIVKTDGRHIYVLRSNKLIIFSAEGADTRQVASVTVCEEPGDGMRSQSGDDYLYEHEYASEMYVSGDKLAVLTAYSKESGLRRGDAYTYEMKQISRVYIYDIHDPAAPTLVTTLGQDGSLLTSRLSDGVLYLISNHWIYDEPNPDDPGTFVPQVYDGAAARPISADCVVIWPQPASLTYTVVGSYSLGDGASIHNQSVLGGGSTVYMNEQNLYVASSSSRQTKSEERTERIYTVVDYRTESVTDIVRFSVSEGQINLAASGTVPGSLLNQFSMDEYNGNFRVVTTTYTHGWTEHTDKIMGWTNYSGHETESANALYITDSDLSIVGALTDVAPDERVYSVRFDGAIGYFVTFRQVDPLFAVDLSDPANPVILSALKIPGFSQYLHVYGDGLLFGLGRDADEETGRTGNIKLSMFDISDPADVFEKDKLLLDYSYSEALYNHKAILISPEKNIIAFPAEHGYDIYSYTEGGFTLRAHVRDLDVYGYNARGLYIGDCAYIVTEARISVLNMTDFSVIANVSY